MKNVGLRHTNGVNLNALFSARLMGGPRAISKDCMALETFSNVLYPTLTLMTNYSFIFQPYET